MEPEHVEFDDATVAAYEAGRYEEALARLRERVEREPEALVACYTHVWLCERVRDTTPYDTEVDLLARALDATHSTGFLDRVRDLFRPCLERMVRCKWCGHFVPGRVATDDERCRHCGAPFPSPDFQWDSPWGMAYCEGRGSWGEDSRASTIWNEMHDRALAEGIVSQR